MAGASRFAARQQRAAGLAAAARVAVLGLLLLPGCRDHAPPSATTRFSLLAVGDAGVHPSKAKPYGRALAVAAAMADDDRRRPVDALLVLGDNFYPSGLKRQELVERIRANLVRPLCHFAASGGNRYSEVADGCEIPPGDRHPVPVYAVLGNHDYYTAESPELQRSEIPRFLSNWRMAERLAESYEVGDGLSLVTFDSAALIEAGSPEPLTEALRASRGPWRILAAHRPIATANAPGPQQADTRAYADLVLRAITASRVEVQLFVSGHEHYLAVMQMQLPAPPLHVISGGGSTPRKNRSRVPSTRAEFTSLGYVRLDWAGLGPQARLVVSVHRVHRYGWQRWIDPRPPAERWSVDRQGRVRRE